MSSVIAVFSVLFMPYAYLARQQRVVLEGVPSPRCVVPIVAVPIFCSVACVEGEGYPTAVFASGRVGDAVVYALSVILGCGVGDEYLFVAYGGNFDACGVFVAVGVGVGVRGVDI